MSPAEQQARIDLAACYRLCAFEGWNDLIYTHISATVPGEPNHYIINPIGYQFDEITASNLVKVNTKGEIVDPKLTLPRKPHWLCHSWGSASHLPRYELCDAST